MLPLMGDREEEVQAILWHGYDELNELRKEVILAKNGECLGVGRHDTRQQEMGYVALGKGKHDDEDGLQQVEKRQP